MADVIRDSVNNVVRALRNSGIPATNINDEYIAINRDGAHNSVACRNLQEWDITKCIRDVAALSCFQGARVDFGRKTDDDWFLMFEEVRS